LFFLSARIGAVFIFIISGAKVRRKVGFQAVICAFFLNIALKLCDYGPKKDIAASYQGMSRA
jgi:hypothetical protein